MSLRSPSPVVDPWFAMLAPSRRRIFTGAKNASPLPAGDPAASHG
jgi:hypothetical protein